MQTHTQGALQVTTSLKGSLKYNISICLQMKNMRKKKGTIWDDRTDHDQPFNLSAPTELIHYRAQRNLEKA